MLFGTSIPHRGPLARPDAIRALATQAERLGFGVLTVSDHIVVPHAIDSPYPYSPDGGFPGGRTGECFEQLSLLNYLAGITEKARLLTSVMVVPHRQPLHAAKAIATADQLSGGRIDLGIGTGWMREEFELLETKPFAERGAVTDEYIRAFKALWSQDNPSFQGDYIRFRDIHFTPKPVQDGGPRIWVGGESGRALRRLATLGDIWYPIAGNPKFPLDTLAAYDAALGRLEAAAEKAGRDPGSIGRAYSAMSHREEAVANAAGERVLLTGTAEQRLGDVAALAERGVTTLICNLAGRTLEEALARQERFAADIIAKTV